MKVFIGSDHGGFQLKEELKRYLGDLGHEVEDMGGHELNPEDDYPDFIFPVALRVAQDKLHGENVVGIVIGRSGNGEVIAANKVKGIRAALCTDQEMARHAREHNDANILSLGADVIDIESAKEIVKVFLETPFSSEERHKRRLAKIADYETAHTK
ncbi:RpiB/LacA/LacB family sugar-phosphate isomerase [Candidatus Microgenomates bacterium]|nr:RpiB/LacA/LacB family sugar-phosphate isomerase [Candidatus Microgenomates bacterium]